MYSYIAAWLQFYCMPIFIYLLQYINYGVFNNASNSSYVMVTAELEMECMWAVVD